MTIWAVKYSLGGVSTLLEIIRNPDLSKYEVIPSELNKFGYQDGPRNTDHANGTYIWLFNVDLIDVLRDNEVDVDRIGPLVLAYDKHIKRTKMEDYIDKL